jgi:hypothetical protein
VTERDTVTETRTETRAETAAAEGAVPAAVEATRAELLAAAETGDYEQLRPLVPEDLSYTFGEQAEGGAIAHWQRLEEEGVSPIAILADLLKLPLTYYQGHYVWPFAFPLSANELTPGDRELLRDVGGEDLSDDFLDDGGYLGWRVGIEPDGDWVFFIAGD